MAITVFVPKTIAKSGEVNANFYYLKDKAFIVPFNQDTLAVNSNTISITATYGAYGYIQAGGAELCDVLDLVTKETIIDGGKMVVGSITNAAGVATFWHYDDIGGTPVNLNYPTGIQLIFPVHSTFEKLPEDVFRREFVDSFEVSPQWNIEDHTSSCNSLNTIFNLSYIPVTNSILIVKNGMSYLNPSDYSINYSLKTVTFVVAPAAGSNLFFQYQYISSIV